jgi:uncharacterized membrane protein
MRQFHWVGAELMVAALIITACLLLTIRNEARNSQLRIFSLQYASESTRSLSSRYYLIVTLIRGAVLLFLISLTWH